MDQQLAAWVPGVNKAFETLCLVMKLDREEGLATSAIRAAHIVFEADRDSITKYGRPIYGEHWTGTWMGPRPAVLSGLLSGDPMVYAMLHERDVVALPSESDPVPTFRLREPDMDKLSQSDVESIAHARAKFVGVSDDQAIREYSQHVLVLGACGGTIQARDMGMNDADRRRLIELEGDMASIYFGD